MLTITTDDIENGINKINKDLQNLFYWLNHNKLKLNVSKTKWMIVGGVKKVNDDLVVINNEIVKRVKCFKSLGVNIDEKFILMNIC